MTEDAVPSIEVGQLLRSFAQGGEEGGATGERLAVMVRIGQTHEQVPPVEDEGDNACHDPAARQVVGGKAAPAPMVLQLVEAVLTISPVPVKLPNRENLGLQRGHQNSIFPGFLALLVD